VLEPSSEYLLELRKIVTHHGMMSLGLIRFDESLSMWRPASRCDWNSRFSPNRLSTECVSIVPWMTSIRLDTVVWSTLACRGWTGYPHYLEPRLSIPLCYC